VAIIILALLHQVIIQSHPNLEHLPLQPQEAFQDPFLEVGPKDSRDLRVNLLHFQLVEEHFKVAIQHLD
jgi:hypothetical protein